MIPISSTFRSVFQITPSNTICPFTPHNGATSTFQCLREDVVFSLDLQFLCGLGRGRISAECNWRTSGVIPFQFPDVFRDIDGSKRRRVGAVKMYHSRGTKEAEDVGRLIRRCI